jgi:hypothetical protein
VAAAAFACVGVVVGLRLLRALWLQVTRRSTTRTAARTAPTAERARPRRFAAPRRHRAIGGCSGCSGGGRSHRVKRRRRRGLSESLHAGAAVERIRRCAKGLRSAAVERMGRCARRLRSRCDRGLHGGCATSEGCARDDKPR